MADTCGVRLAYFCTGGSLSLLPLQRLTERHDVLAVVRPAPGKSRAARRAGLFARRLGFPGPDAIDEWAVERGIPSFRMLSARDANVVSELRRLAPELICISTFRWILKPELLAVPSLGAINLHSSLLPRHRGPIPLFWVYHEDDRVTGMTVHKVIERADAGDVILQESFPLPRGFPIEQLNEENALVGSAMLARAVDAFEVLTAKATPQDESCATSAPLLRRNARMIDFDAWGAERVWHFLAGLFSRYREPLTDAAGRRVAYADVLGYEEGPPPDRPGALIRAGGTWRLSCRDGVVLLSAASAG